VAIGDINNDQLPDLFFCSNQQSNKLYLNKGNWQFEDITESAGLATQGIWSTGVTMADVNGDGWLDIYVCKSGNPDGQHRSNELFINNGTSPDGWRGGFTEKAHEYGLDNHGLSTHAAFFDYDNDGDLDCYLLNNSIRSVGNYDLIKDQRNIPDTAGGNKLFRNDSSPSTGGGRGEAHFIDVTAAAGIYSSSIGFGLGVTIADINKDGWADIYVSNDFFEKDYLYINRHNGRFEESLEKYIREISLNSMGADVADINNDGYPEVYVTDMLPEDEGRLKTKTTFENWDKYRANEQSGYYRQFIRNVLQLNNGPSFTHAGVADWAGMSEIGRMAGVCATDWSWGALITDLDNDGYKDIFVANGIYKDITDQDYIQYTASAYTGIRQQIINKEKNIITRLVDLIPSHAIPNYAYSNNGNLTFTNKAAAWGLDEPGFSNGAAYGDLDNDGDLDLVINNVNSPCFMYRNNSEELHPENKFLKVILKGEGKNRFGIGAQVTVHYNHTLAYQEQMPMRGFESTVDNRLNFGLGGASKIDSLVVVWPDGRRHILHDVAMDQQIIIEQSTAGENCQPAKMLEKALLHEIAATKTGIDFIHKENDFTDFDRDRLIFQMLSREGPRMAKGDVNKDGREDIYICGAKDQPGALFVQQANGRFIKGDAAVFEKDKTSEDTDALFFDADGDGDEDLYVCSGGNEFSANSTALIDRLYLNNGKGGFSKSPQVLPSYIFENSSCVRAADYDQDGDMDLFVGVRLKPFAYGNPCKGYMLQNNGKGIFTDVTDLMAPDLKAAGMITDAQWLDYDRDGKTDLVVTGEYMPVTMYHNVGGKLKEVSGVAGLHKSNGWWNRLIVADVNDDGYPDLVAGNHGLNSRFKASLQKPVRMYASDFDGSGIIKQVVSCYNGDNAYPMALRHDLVSVLPYLKNKYLKYESYKLQRMEDIFTKEQLDKAVKLQAYEFCSCLFINNGHGGFIRNALPTAAQLSPMYGIAIADVDGDGKKDILMGGNFYQSKPEAGIYDASFGVLLKGDGTGHFTAMTSQQSSIQIKGAVRDIITLKAGKKKLMLFACNDSEMKCYEY
jgi:hypothetical protein